ncbi:MAG TPA: hypothetical protein VKG43_02365 [Acidimicrobiales bacterium]|nr:hypothetical protein [Acidimicrobiales bacterium]
MSSLWTPSGEHFPREEGGDGAPPHASPTHDTDVTDPSHEASQAAAQAEVDAMRAQLANTPAEVVVANHCYGLFELAAVYLSADPPLLDQARLPIDALGAIVEALEGRLGEAERSLREALAQLRLAFVQIQAVAEGEGSGPAGANGSGEPPAGGA